MKKILITGVFSSGKTSLIDLVKRELELLNKKVFFYSEVARECPFDLNLKQNNNSTSWLVMRQIENEINSRNLNYDFCLFDRGIPDIISHARYVLNDNADDLLFFNKLKDLGKASLCQFDYVFVAKRSDEFPIENDGLRINDTNFQKSLEFFHDEYLNEIGSIFIVLAENNKERVSQILSVIMSQHSL